MCEQKKASKTPVMSRFVIQIICPYIKKICLVPFIVIEINMTSNMFVLWQHAYKDHNRPLKRQLNDLRLSDVHVRTYSNNRDPLYSISLHNVSNPFKYKSDIWQMKGITRKLFKSLSSTEELNTLSALIPHLVFWWCPLRRLSNTSNSTINYHVFMFFRYFL